MLKPILLGLLLAVPSIGNAAAFDPPAAQAAMTHEGKVVSVSDAKLVMKDNNGKNEHTHMITAAAVIMLNGKSAKVTDLKPGDAIKVTTSAEGTVTMVEATRAAAPTL